MRALLIVAMCAAPLAATAQSASEKACILSAAQKLPTVPGITITSAAAKSMAVEEAAKQVVSSFGSNESAVATLNPAFGFLDAKLQDAVQYQYSAGGPDQVRNAVTVALQGQIVNASSVEIAAKVAGMDAAFGSICVIGASGQYVTPPVVLR